MSIIDCLAFQVGEKALFEVKPILRSRRGKPRSVWAEKFVFEQLSPDTANPIYELESGRMRRKLESIASGNSIIVGDRTEKNCDVKRLEPTTNEVWEIRERDHPSIRLFFRFVQLDCIATTNLRFVSELFSLNWIRHGLDFWLIWRIEIRRCKAIWRRLFLTFDPHSGDHLNDYLSNASGSGSF